MQNNTLLPLSNNIADSIKAFSGSMWTSVPYHDWWGWPFVLPIIGVWVTVFILLWFWRNFWRKSSGELPKGYKMKL